ncbi:uncharacterized protein N7515_009090 [Penicillium bovifimosum]|uniref:Uncharacterized protein n=1 Tax=Penicillium bovifimosum TaxID=126998 RepID=A0A9W9GIW0_9EURO|nr:uncharacterized protein N7515_009090 [Penicillium bovifimosum]KAJ5121129.1 hypothetical protein N7515_009090 [Penicillium bovifimosum]
MRLHLVISRHGLPVTRILWTTTSSTSTLGEYGTHRPAPAAAIASSRTPNVAFSNGGYTIAQLLEDVNEVVPLETEPSVFDAEFSGQWGLEDYVVEVAGSECLHFMEVEGLLRDGDEVVIRALQLADLRARRLCGRHQITAEGKHLIDGVAFGSPFLKRTTTSRPAITIPPRKKRRTVLSGWEQPSDFVPAPVHVDEEEDGEWLPPPETGFGKELSIMAGEHDESLGTVIRHPVDYTAESESEAEVSEMSDIEENELESELKALKEDFEEPSQFVDIRNQTRGASGHAVRAASIVKRPTSKGSIAAASSLSSKRSRGDDSSPRTSKAVRFNKGAGKEDEAMPDLPQAVQAPPVEDSVAESSESDSSESSASSSDSDSEEESDSDSDEASSSEVEPASEASDSDSSSSSEDSDSSESESEEEAPPPPKTVQRPVVSGIPGEGTMRTKKSNNRLKLRRRLSKLKELGALPQEADFEALRAWEQSHGGWHFPEQPVKPEPVVEPQQHVEPEMESAEALRKKQKRDKKQQEQEEFEARRQKLLQDLASGNGVYVDATSEKENVPPRASASIAQPLVSQDVSDEAEREQDASHRRNLDIASSRRMLFGERGMRTPKTKEDEEETRQKLAAAASAIGRPRKRSAQAAKEEADQMQEDEDESDINWQNKLVIRAVECVYPDVEMTAPPYPFVQRWDQEANDLIRQLKGPSKKRKRKQRVQVYDAYEEEYDEDANYYGGDDQYQDGADQENYEDYHAEEAPYYEGHYAGGGEANQLNYDDGPEPEPAPNASSDDLPALPSDVGTLSDLKESDVKVGAIIAFRQLDMSKATNWQPEMSGYRVAEVRSLQGKGVMNVLLAKRDRKPTSAFSEDDEPRQFSKFEVPDLANEEGEDDGYRELVFAELSEPKLLRPADRSDSVYGDQNNTREGSIVSVVQESVPIVQPGSPEEMYLDDTTFVTMGNDVTHLESPRESPGMPDESIEQTPGRPAVPQIQVQASDHRRVTPPIPSPTFTGFHSALSRQQTTPGLDNGRELEGRTLIGGETPSALVNRDEDPSMLTYMSANQSFADDPEDEDENEESFQSQEHERQVVPESLAPPGESGDSGAPSGSLLSTIDRAGSQGAQESTPVEKEVKEEVRKEVKEEKRSAAPTSSAESWRQLLDRLRNKSEPEPEMMSLSDSPGPFEDSEQLQDSLLQSNVELDFSFIDTARASSSRSPHPTMSAQQDAQSQKPNPFPPSSPSESPSLFTRSKHSQHALKSSAASQIPASQVSEVIDLTSSPRGSPEPSGSNLKLSQRSKSALFGDSQLDDGSRSSRQLTRASTGNIQHMVGVSVSPSSIKKKRTSRKF